MDRPWETCMTICHQWAWKPNDKMKSLEECIQHADPHPAATATCCSTSARCRTARSKAARSSASRKWAQWLAKNGEPSTAPAAARGNLPLTWSAPARATRSISTFSEKWMDPSPSPPCQSPSSPQKSSTARILKPPPPMARSRWKSQTTHRDPIDTIIELTIDGDAMDIVPLKPSRPLEYHRREGLRIRDLSERPAIQRRHGP